MDDTMIRLMEKLGTYDRDNREEQAGERRMYYDSIVRYVLSVLKEAEDALDAFMEFLSYSEPEVYGDKSTAGFFNLVSEGINAVISKINEEEYGKHKDT